MEDFSAWVGRTEETEDVMAAAPLAGLAALLDREPWTGEAPPLAHWLCFLPQTRQSRIDRDGHPERGGLLPPITLPRRMWAGGKLRFHAPIAIGAPLVRRSSIAAITPKRGASGDLLFVTLRHEIAAAGVASISEEQVLVYREAATSAPMSGQVPTEAPRPSDDTTRIVPDSVMLFRFSALTFNAHRIHYDRDYARDEEGYPGLVVHGPLQAMLLMHHFLATAPDRRVQSFSFRAQRPLFDTDVFDLCRAGADLWTRDASGVTGMTARIGAA
ncbi:FAS1-like dehydratase domain-containing protein [Flavisphingomonas formosensis]|uniref:FAS1-like dehydratase domain-containing protein n=1 Tax=Flavisphingomonas formosensis TaxID=861534 RepID=UPI0012F9072E|nr:MaoC family dehydratase N-terminal domain-containing protein [Sphingomonas formosensis]